MCRARVRRCVKYAKVSRQHVPGLGRVAMPLSVCAVLEKNARPHKDAVVVYLIHDSDSDDASGDEQPS